MTNKTAKNIFLELCEKHHLSVRYWHGSGTGDFELSLYLDLGNFEHEQQATQYIMDNFEEKE